MDKFEEWFASQDFYTNMRFIHGDGLFIKDGEVYRVLPAQMAWEAWQSRQAEVDELNQLYLKAQHQEVRHRTIAQDALAEIEEKDKRIEAALVIVSKMAKATNSTAMWAYDLDKALRGDNANS